MQGTGGAILEQDTTQLAQGPACGKAEPLQAPVATEPVAQGAGKRGTLRCGQLLIERLVADLEAPSGLQAAVEIGERFPWLTR